MDTEIRIRLFVRRQADYPFAAGGHDAAAVAQPFATRRCQMPPVEEPPEVTRGQASRIGT
jgi:hypothetical protein